MEQNSRKYTANRGFTLIEIIVSIVIMGLALGVLVPFYNAVSHSPDPVIRERAIALGQALMDEIMAKRWDENTPMGGGPLLTGESSRGSGSPAASLGPDGESRIDYDDVDDYHGLNENGTFSDQNGNSFSLPNYSRQVSVRYIASSANPIDQNTPAAAGATDSKLAVVSVTSPLGETFFFISVACNL